MTIIEELRSFKILKVAVFDVFFGTIGLIFLAMTGLFGNTIKNNPILFGIIGVFPIGEIFHILFKVNTPVLKSIGIIYK